jgi:hypothetical protein
MEEGADTLYQLQVECANGKEYLIIMSMPLVLKLVLVALFGATMNRFLLYFSSFFHTTKLSSNITSNDLLDETAVILK